MIKYLMFLAIGFLHVSTFETDLTWVNIDLENASRNGNPTNPYVIDDGVKYRLFVDLNKKGKTDASVPWITTGVHNNGKHSLGCRLYPDTDGVKERSEIITSLGNESYALKMNRLRYWSQSFLVHNHSDANVEPVVLMQVHQSGISGKPLPPPFVIWVKVVNNKVLIKGEIKNANGSSDALFDFQTIGGKNEWFDLSLKIAPRVDGHLGEIQVRLNDKKISLSNKERRYWGYPKGKGIDKWRLSSGLYKAPSSNGSNFKNTLIVFLDDIKLGSSWKAVQA